MIIKSRANSNFKCSCGITLGTCKNLEHPQKFQHYLGNSRDRYIERWALSKYKVWDSEISIHNKIGGLTKIGRMVSDYKYKKLMNYAPFKELNQDEINQLKDTCLKEIYRHVKYFLDNYFPKEVREFNTVVPIPPTTPTQRTIPFEISNLLQNDKLINLKSFVQVTDIEIPKGKTKNIRDFNEKEEALRKKFILGDIKNIENSSGVLVIDDVYKTGATARRVLNIINSIAPNIPKYFLSVAFTVLDEVKAGEKS